MVKRNTRKYNRRSRKSGGGWGFTGQSLPGVSNYGQINTPIGDCRAAQPSGYISSFSPKGLPGLSGGRRHRGGGFNNDGTEQINGTGNLARNLANNNTLIDEELVANQSGGRYSFDLSDPQPGAAAPWAGGIPPVQRIPCESASTTANSLNKHSGGARHSGGAFSFKNITRRFKRNLKGLKKFVPSLKNAKRYSLKGLKGLKKFPMKGLKGLKRYSLKGLKGLKKFPMKGLKGLKRYSLKGLKGLKKFVGRGGASNLGGDNLAYYAPTAGYDNKPSTWLDSVGAPVQLQIPYEARSWNPACLKTGGKRRGGSRKH